MVGDYQADQDGSIDDPIIWGGDVGPVSGDTNTWDLNIYSISAPSNATFEGETLYIPEGASLVKSTGGNNAAVLNLNNLELDGGTIKSDQENGLFTLDLQGNTLQLNSGEFYTGANGVAPRTFNIQNAVLAGSGTITVDSARTGTPANRWVNFNASVSNANTMAGFTGTFSLVNNGVIAFPELIDPYFGVEIATTNAQLILTNLVAFSSLVLGGEPVASGQYFYADLTTNQQAYFVDGGGGVAVGQSIFVLPNAADILISYDMGMILVGSTNLSDHPAVTNWLQMKTDLVNGDEWSDVDMSTGVTETNWNVVVVTNGAFFQIESRY